jgi:hypothetical protein
VSDNDSVSSDLDERALEMRIRGESHFEIGSQLGITPQEAREAVSRALAAQPMPTREESRAQALGRLDELETAVRRLMELGGPKDKKKAQAELRKIEALRRRIGGTK